MTRRLLDAESPTAVVRQVVGAGAGPRPAGVGAPRRARPARSGRAGAVRRRRRVGRRGRGAARGDRPRAAARRPCSTRSSRRPRWRPREAEPAARWLPPIAAGECLATVATSDPAGADDLDAPGVTARRDGAGWVLDGAKGFVVGGGQAHLLLVTATTPDGPELFAVPADADRAHAGRRPGPRPDPLSRAGRPRRDAGDAAGPGPGRHRGPAAARRCLAGERADGRGGALPRARRGAREDAGAVRPADRLVPGRQAPARRRPGRGGGRARRPPTTPPGAAATAATRPVVRGQRREGRLLATPTSRPAAAACRCTAASASPGSTTCTCTSSGPEGAGRCSAPRTGTASCWPPADWRRHRDAGRPARSRRPGAARPVSRAQPSATRRHRARRRAAASRHRPAVPPRRAPRAGSAWRW